jgi:MoxR-like ATPase
MNKEQHDGTLDVRQIKITCDAVRKEVAKVVVGYEDVVDDFLVCLIAQGHMFMLGVPGIAKTTLAKTFATVTGLRWNRVQFTQDLLPSDIVGHMFYDQKANDFKLRMGPIFSELVLADEINRAPPKTQSALIEAMQEHQVTIEGQTLPLPQPFLVIATKNPVETEGVYPLPEAQLDRFLYRVTMDYLSTKKEFELLKMKAANVYASVQPVGKEWITQLIGMHHQVYADESIMQYIVRILRETREAEELVIGGSPRAGEHLLYAAKAYALIHGKNYVIPDYVKTVAPKVLGHRVILSAESELEGLSSDKVVYDILSRVEIPDILETDIKSN